MPARSSLHVPQRFAAYLAAGERVLGLVAATRDVGTLDGLSTHTGTVILTDRRLVFAASTPDDGEIGYYPLTAIDRVDGTRSLLGWQISFRHTGSAIRLKWITAPAAKSFYRALRDQQKVAIREERKLRIQTDSPARHVA